MVRQEIILNFLDKIKETDIPENKRGILEASAKAFNPYSRPPITQLYEDRISSQLEQLERKMKNNLEEDKKRNKILIG